MKLNIGGFNRKDSPPPRLVVSDSDIVFTGYKTSIMKWMYKHKTLEVDISDRFIDSKGNRCITICIGERVSTPAKEYGKALGMGIMGEVPGAIGIATGLIDAATSVAPSPNLRGEPGKFRSFVDRRIGSKYVLELRAMAQSHPNPHANLKVMNVPTTLQTIIGKVENMSW